MKEPREMIRATNIIVKQSGEDGMAGEFISRDGWTGTFIASWGGGWEHVSVCPYKRRIMPSWNDMCDLKEKFWNDDEWVVEYHPAKNEYVNNMPNCLHLWKAIYEAFPTPPSFMIGMKPGQTKADLEREIREYEKTRNGGIT